MAYAVARLLFLDRLAALLDPLARALLNSGANCLLVGHIALHPIISDMTSMVFPMFHLAWRLRQALAKSQLHLTMINFMLMPDGHIEDFHRHLKRGEWPLGCNESASGQKWTARHGESSGPDARATSAWRQTTKLQASLSGRLMRHTMCYPVHYSDRTVFKLRPNRDSEARSRLSVRIAASHIAATLVLVLLLLPIMAHTFLVTLSDRVYMRAYPGCFEQLEELRAKGELPLFAVTLRGHHLVALLADVSLNAVVWLDSGLALSYLATLCYLLNYDLMLYWSSLQMKLEEVLSRARQRSWFYLGEEWPLGDGPGPNGMASRRRRSTYDLGGDGDGQLETDICELNFGWHDFFSEVGRVDMAVSEIVTHALLIWLISCAVFSYEVAVSSGLSSFLAVLQGLFFVGLTVIAAGDRLILGLHRNCLRTYQTMCSLMAVSEHGAENMRLLKLMEFFGKNDRTTFTLAHYYPYKPTTFITIAGYSLSCLLIALGLFGKSPKAMENSGPGAAAIESNASLLERIVHILMIY
jgi:hypothetical protein